MTGLLAVCLVALAGVGSGAAAPLGPDETASRNMQLVTNVPKLPPFSAASFNGDLAFWGKYAFQANSDGFRILDISDPASPQAISTVLCLGANDISVWKNLLFISVDSSRSDDSCVSTPQPATIKESWEGIRIFDISDVANPRYIKSVETKCGSHTHTLVPDGDRVLLYVSSFGPDAAFPDCQPPHDKISIVEVPLSTPTNASVIAEPVLFPGGGYDGSNGQTAATEGCHDITAYPALDLAVGACMGNGIIMNIADPANPRVRSTIFNPNFSFWHSATISHDGSKVLFTDERGGGVTPQCNLSVGPTKGAVAVYNIRSRAVPVFLSHFKIPREQAASENCTAHNGNLLPIRSRDILVQGWLQGGVSMIDWTNGRRITEIAWFDRGPWLDGSGVAGLAGAWSSYWYNGRIYSSELQRGFDVLRLTNLPSLLTLLSRRLPYLNPQTQERLPRGWN